MKDLTFEEALEIAKSLTRGFNHCIETEDAFIFNEKDRVADGGHLPIIITKKGEAFGSRGYI